MSKGAARLLAALAIAFSGACPAKVTLQTLRSDAAAKPTGDRVLIVAQPASGSHVDEQAVAHVRDEAAAWLQARGYKLERSPRKAHTALTFFLMRQPHQGGVGEEQALGLRIWAYRNGVAPLLADEIDVFASDTREKFFDDASVLSDSVAKALAASMLGRVKSAPAPADAADPGCWYMMGIAFDTKPMRDGLYFIKGFTEGSRAPLVGLQPLDQVVEVNGQPIKDVFPPKFREGDTPTVAYIRNYQRHEVTLPLTYFCAADPAPPP